MTSTVGGEDRPSSTVQPAPYLPPVMAAPPAGCTETNMSSPLGESSQYPGQEDMTGETETEVFVVEASTESPSAMGRQANQVGGPDVSREGPYDVYDVPPESGQSPLIVNSMPGCQYRMTSYDDHLHDPRMMEYMGAPESARLLGRTPEYWLEHMGRESTVAAALRLHHDASLIMTNVQVMAQFVTSLNRTASEVMRVVYEKEPFPTDAIQYVAQYAESGVRHTIWQLWACGAPQADRSSQVQFQYRHATRAYHVKTAYRMFRCERLCMTFVFLHVADVYILRTLTESYSVVRHSIYSLVSVVIFDGFSSFYDRFFWLFRILEFYLCHKCCHCDYLVGFIHIYGAGCPWDSHWFLEHVRAGGGG